MKINKLKLKKILQILALGFCYYLFITLTGVSIPCPVRTATHGHILCPGCGISRMCLSAAKLDLKSAFYWNPVIFCLSPVWFADIILWIFDKGQRFIFVTEVISIVLLIAYFIIRNIPGWPLY